MRTTDGVELAVTDFGGEGLPIVLLHGLMGCAATWTAVASWLTARGRVLGLDARGHGRSQARGPWTTQRMAADVVELLDAVGPAVVVGHSMGGLHGLVAAARRPDLVHGLVVEDMAVDFRGADADAARSWFGALRQPFPTLAAVREAFGPPESGEYMAACAEERADGWYLRCALDEAVEIAAEWARVDHWAELDAIRCPVLLLEAEESVAPPGQIAAMAARLADATHLRLPDTGHLLHAVAPAAYRAAVESFLAAATPR